MQGKTIWDDLHNLGPEVSMNNKGTTIVEWHIPRRIHGNHLTISLKKISVKTISKTPSTVILALMTKHAGPFWTRNELHGWKLGRKVVLNCVDNWFAQSGQVQVLDQSNSDSMAAGDNSDHRKKKHHQDAPTLEL
jgi:hypothetical protein